jgi:hypothetical protein
MLYQLSYVRVSTQDSACISASELDAASWAEPGFARAQPLYDE